jgi:hypothetical protein
VSTIAVEEDALTTWLVDYLEADTTLMSMLNGQVCPEVDWTSEASPFVRVDRLDGNDLMVIGLFRVWVDTTYHIRGVQHWRGGGRPDRTDINAIGARLDLLLHKKEATTATHQIHSFREEAEPSPTVLEPTGALWLQSGGIYRLRVAAL